MKKLITLFFILAAIAADAQQDALYSQYMFNPFTLNPAYAGSRKAISGVLLYRNQWAGLDGAPTSQTFSIHSPIKEKKIALGFNLINEKIGPSNNIGASGTYAYHLPLGEGVLAMAIRGGVYRFQMDGQLLDYKDKTDKLNNASITSRMVPSFDFGAYYYTNSFYAGLAVTHLSQQKIGYYDIDNLQAQLYRHFIATAGKAIAINENFVLKPSLMARYVDGAPVNFDVNMSALFHKVFWLGVSYRSSKDLVLITELNITDFLRIGYSYDLSFSQLRKYNSGTHEIFLGFDFDFSKTKSVSPRYL